MFSVSVLYLVSVSVSFVSGVFILFPMLLFAYRIGPIMLWIVLVKIFIYSVAVRLVFILQYNT
jgi:hypothetical protein